MVINGSPLLAWVSADWVTNSSGVIMTPQRDMSKSYSPGWQM